jgi:hypothetical protein
MLEDALISVLFFSDPVLAEPFLVEPFCADPFLVDFLFADSLKYAVSACPV